MTIDLLVKIEISINVERYYSNLLLFAIIFCIFLFKQ